VEYNNKWIKDILHARHIQKIVHVTVYLACFPSPSHLVFIEFGMTFMTLKTILSYTNFLLSVITTWQIHECVMRGDLI